MAKTKYVFSQLGCPLAFQYVNEAGDIERVVLKKGLNKVDAKALNVVSKKVAFENHESNGFLKVYDDFGNIEDAQWLAIEDEAPDRLINHLSARSTEVDTDVDPFDGTQATSRDGNRRLQRDRVEAIKQRYAPK